MRKRMVLASVERPLAEDAVTAEERDDATLFHLLF
jgi:hypothetical protein